MTFHSSLNGQKHQNDFSIGKFNLKDINFTSHR